MNFHVDDDDDDDYYLHSPSPKGDEMLKTEGKTQCFQHFLRDLESINALEKTFLIYI